MNDAIKKFETAARKADRMLGALATIEVAHDMSSWQLAEPLVKAINRLYRHVSATVGEPGQTERLAVISSLIARRIAATEFLSQRIAEARSIKLRELAIESARIANSRPY